MKALNILFFTIILAGVSGFSQDKTNPDKAIIKPAIAFSPGFLTEQTQTGQLHFSIGITPKSKKLVFRADGFYYLGAIGERPRFTINHQFYLGGFYQFSNNKLQPYLGFQPGLAWSQSSEFGVINDDSGEIDFERTLNPVSSFVGGIDYYLSKKAALLFETRYIVGKHKSNSFPIFLDELRFSVGFRFDF